RMPTWDMYSCEYVSDTIPTQMYFDQSRSVDITFRNRGVLWSDERDFKLGAVDDSDPFAATRHAITSEIGPGDTYTFTFMMTAPSVEGSYTTDWQMVREGIAWFGPVVVKDVYVWPSGVPGDCDGDFDVDQEDFVLFESCASGPAIPYTGDCSDADFDSDGDVDQDDFAIFQCCYSGENIAADPNCAD
ncbi:MAG: hypothetical protein JSV03_15135, partial [Planctomycetota bacterium]